MLKSLMLATACAYIHPSGLEQTPVVQATPTEILKQAYAMKPGTQKVIVIDHGDGLDFATPWQRRTNVWRKVANPARAPMRLQSDQIRQPTSICQ
jgi:hypothetical protein